jgi:hypothetical protein
MSRFTPIEGSDLKEERVRLRALVIGRAGLFLGMGLAGILTVALIVTADRSYAGIDGMRAVTVFAPAHEQDPPRPAPGVPLGPVAQPELPVASPPVVAIGVPAAQPTASTPPSSSPAPSPVPGSPSPTPSAGPTATPGPTPTPTPTPAVAVTTDRGAVAAVNLNDLVPGDTIVRTIAVRNIGTLSFRYAVSATQTASTLLWTDTANGVQLAVSTLGGTVLYTGPLSSLGSVAGPSILAPGTNETLRYTFTFPVSAANPFQGLRQDLTLVFDAVEYP